MSESDCIGLSSAPPSLYHTPPPPPELPVAVLLRHARAGRLQDAHQMLCQYIMTLTLDSTTGRPELGLFNESVKAAIANRHAPLVSYLFFFGIGKPSLCIEDALKARSTAIFEVFLEYRWDINKPLGRNKAPPLRWVFS